jgi:hypothetical protein
MPQQNIFSPKEFKEKYVKAPLAIRTKKEEKLQIAVCAYLRKAYPDVIWFCDVASGLKLPIWLGSLHSKMRSSRGLPDLFIAHACVDNETIDPEMKCLPSGCILFEKGSVRPKIYSGLFIELKASSADPVILKSGKLSGNKHIQEQNAIHERLRSQGYRAQFCQGFEETKKVIDEYLQ